MAWTYSGNPSSSTLDAVRFLTGDTDTTDQLLSDAEITYIITENATVLRSASESCRAIAAKFARLMSRSVGGLSADFSAKYSQYLQLADNIMSREEVSAVRPFISGYTISQKNALEEDTDRESTFARKGDMDNRRVVPGDEYTQYRNT